MLDLYIVLTIVVAVMTYRKKGVEVCSPDMEWTTLHYVCFGSIGLSMVICKIMNRNIMK